MALSALERKLRFREKGSQGFLSRRLPRDLSRYSLKAGGEDSVRKRAALEEARRLGWLKKPVLDD